MDPTSDQPPSLPRRDFLKLLGSAGMAVALAGTASATEPEEPSSQWGKLVPADKHFDPAWLQSLTARGTPTVYRGDQLKFIGMPVGGLCAGHLYLGGDGRLWLWDVFNELHNTAGEHYAHPQLPFSPLAQGFALQIKDQPQPRVFTLDSSGFSDIAFTGQYPIGTVDYRHPACPVTVQLQAFSPFCPLDVDFSSLPATVMRFTIHNPGNTGVQLEIGGWLENKICKNSLDLCNGVRHWNHSSQSTGRFVTATAAVNVPASSQPIRSTVVFEDFERDDFAPWAVQGTAFGSGPTAGAPDPEQKLHGFAGKKLANSWALKSDAPTGKLISPPFVIRRRYINLLLAGGNHPGQTCINLIIDGQLIDSATGQDTDVLQPICWDVSALQDKTAHLEIIDDFTGGWGHIDIDQIEFSDTPAGTGKLSEQFDFGTMTLGIADRSATARAVPGAAGAPGSHGVSAEGAGDSWASGAESRSWAERLFSATALTEPTAATPVAGLVLDLSLAPGESKAVAFVVTWHFPNLKFALTRWDPNHAVQANDLLETGRHYASRFDSSVAVAQHVTDQHDQFYNQTRLWVDTWSDSTLPHWFLERTFTNISTLATATAYRFADGRFWGWEGVGSCRGTCTHVWGYEQSMGRLFPELDILLRERTDFAAGFSAKTGAIGMRGERSGPAVDGSCMVMLRCLRDHQMSADDSFLRRNWSNIKPAMQWLLHRDINQDGILVTAQANTLDAEWFGAVPWITGLYLAALAAADRMATVVGDADFARICRDRLAAGQSNFCRMFNGEYFIQIPDARHAKAVGSFDGCEIDQLLGQSWAWAVGLGRVLPAAQTESALSAIWRYNFAPDVGPFRAVHKPGRWFAMPGEAGVLMCSWPAGESKRVGTGFDYYFNECMNGFEHQLAGHLIWENKITEGLAVERALHDRYHASKRNPWNEIECGDHYARSMASYGVFLAACGYGCDGPAGRLEFAPRITPEHFKAAFVAPRGWGTFEQSIAAHIHHVTLQLRYGELRLQELVLTPTAAVRSATATLAGKAVAVQLEQLDGKTLLRLSATVTAGQTLQIQLQ